MLSKTLPNTHRRPAGTYSHRKRCRISATATTPGLAPLQVTYTFDRRDIDVGELADLMSRCATHSPGHATHIDEGRCHPETTTLQSSDRFQRRLTRALSNSLVYVAAYAPEASLPPHLHRAARGLLQPSTTVGAASASGPPLLGDLWRLAPGILPVLGPRVLIGFARAVGDASLVATIHDVAVIPELRGRGLGVNLVQKVTQQVRNG